ARWQAPPAPPAPEQPGQPELPGRQEERVARLAPARSWSRCRRRERYWRPWRRAACARAWWRLRQRRSRGSRGYCRTSCDFLADASARNGRTDGRSRWVSLEESRCEAGWMGAADGRPGPRKHAGVLKLAPCRRGGKRGCRGRGGAGRRPWLECLVDHLAELGLADGPDLGGLDLPVLEQQQHRDRPHVVLHGRVAVLVDVDLHHLGLAGVLGRQLVQGRGDHLAGTAPLRPEIDQHRLLGL